MDAGDYINIQIYAIKSKNGKVSYYMGDSDWNKSRITSDYTPADFKTCVGRFKEYLKYSKNSIKKRKL